MIGKRLAEIRKARGDTQHALAEKLGVSLFTVRSWEQEKSAPTCEMLALLCRMYGVSADDLLGLSETPSAMQEDMALTEEEREQLCAFREFLLWKRTKESPRS